LLKLYYQLTSPPISFTEFPHPPHPPPFPHVEIYTWPDCTLRELTSLLTSALPETGAIGNRDKLVFRLVYGDQRTGKYCITDLGQLPIPPPPPIEEDEPEKGLKEMGFVQGDWIVA